MCLMKLKYQFNDGGRFLAGYSGGAGDCVVRALSIATGSSYSNMYEFVNRTARCFESHSKVKSSNVYGIYSNSVKGIMKILRLKWIAKKSNGMLVIPTKGTYIVSLIGHVCAVVDGTIHDTHNTINPINLTLAQGYWKVK